MCANFGFAALGGEPLAALRAATGNDAAAALGRHAGAKAVPALANEPARLIGAFHWKNLRWRLGVDWPLWIELPFIDCVGTRGANGLVGSRGNSGPPQQNPAAYTGGRQGASM
jgi:hypothetical protein